MIWPAGQLPDKSNAEIVRVTAVATDTFTITRAQEGTSARTVVVGDHIAAIISADNLVDVERVTRFREHPQMFTDFPGTGAGNMSPWTISLVASGTIAQQAPTDGDHPGIIRVTSSTSSNSGAYVNTGLSHLLLMPGDYLECIFSIVTLTNGTFRHGFIDTSSSSDCTDGVYFEIASTGVATFKTANNGSRSSAGTTATLSTATWYRMEIDVNTASDVRGRIYNSDTGAVVLAEQQLTTNIPTASGRNCGPGMIVTNSGTSATAMVDWDLLSYENRPGYGLTR